MVGMVVVGKNVGVDGVGDVVGSDADEGGVFVGTAVGGWDGMDVGSAKLGARVSVGVRGAAVGVAVGTPEVGVDGGGAELGAMIGGGVCGATVGVAIGETELLVFHVDSVQCPRMKEK